MVERIIKEIDGHSIYLKYDQDNYDIEYVELYQKTILRRLADDKIIRIFDGKIGFIVQCNTDKYINFLVTTKRNDYGREVIEFEHYVDSGHLMKMRVFPCSSTELSALRLTDRSYLVGDNCIYNLEKKTESFKNIYHDQSIRDYFDENVLLVSEERNIFSFRDDLIDTITYGMNPETFEIVTPIWSDLQQRLIRLYSKEKVVQLNEEGKIYGTDVGTVTICFEVDQYLYLLAGYFDQPVGVYLDDECNINKEFMKKFVEK